MNESLFWQDGFPKARRAELVANLLYSGDPNARIPNNEGLRPERVDDFYQAVGFTSLEDLDDRLDEVSLKYRFGDSAFENTLAPAQVPAAPRVLPSVDPFAKFFSTEETKTRGTSRKSQVEKPVVAVPEEKIPRPRVRKPRVAVPEQRIVPVPPLRIEPGIEAPIVEAAPVLPTPDTRYPTPETHPEDRVSAFARGVLTWFGGAKRDARRAEVVNDRIDAGRMREVIEKLFAKELGEKISDGKAHVEAANRLERAIATSAHLEPGVRTAMKERSAALRSAYEGRMREVVRSRSDELQAGIDDVAMQERDSANSALHTLATRSGNIADDVMKFRGQIEHAAVQRGGVESVAAVDEAFQEAWRNAWTGAVTPIDIGPLEESLPRLRLLEGNRHSGIAQMVVAARASVQEDIDRRLPRLEREMKRAA